ncbi:hypothetical protein SB861_39250 [Paraburkholderia sp. SIMBA_049]
MPTAAGRHGTSAKFCRAPVLITAIIITAFNALNPGLRDSTRDPARLSSHLFSVFYYCMANRSLPITLTRAYSRTDFTALRAFVQRVPSATIARLYFSEDSDGNAPTAGWVSTYLREMQAVLVDVH